MNEKITFQIRYILYLNKQTSNLEKNIINYIMVSDFVLSYQVTEFVCPLSGRTWAGHLAYSTLVMPRCKV
jgi:hypothetical protein